MKSPLSNVRNHLPLRQIILAIVLAACASLITGCGDTRFHFFGHGHVTASPLAPVAANALAKNSLASADHRPLPTSSPAYLWRDRLVCIYENAPVLHNLGY